jgi:acyl-CoA thioester hydrolase
MRTASRRNSYVHFTEITTRWMDNDVYGHVNNAVYYSFFDTAVNQHLIVSGCLDAAHSPVIGLVVETSCQYFTPISFPATVHAGLRVAKLGTSSVRYEIGLFQNGDETAAAEGYFVHVYVDRATNKPVPVPDKFRRALSALKSESHGAGS